MKSPFTGKEMKQVYEKRTWKFRGEEYEYIHAAWLCEDSGELFTTDETDDVGYAQVTNQYRVKYGIPFTDEIISVRERYGLSAAKMSLILGVGINQWRYYESGEVPNVSNGRMIRSIMKPETFLDYVHSAKHLLDEGEYAKLVKKIGGLANVGQEDVKYQYACSRIFLCERGHENGYGKQSLEHLKNILLYIIENCQGVFQTKMNKLLFYVDFLAYCRRGMAMTGLSYKAINFGPVPIRWDRVYSQFDEILQVPRLVGDWEGVELLSMVKADKTQLTDFELEILNEVCMRFSSTSSKDLTQLSHNEDAWIQNVENQAPISFNYAFGLKGI